MGRVDAMRLLVACAVIASLAAPSDAHRRLGGAEGEGAGRQLLQFGFCPPEVGTEAFDFLLTRTTFSHPEVGGEKLDFCLSPGDGCGQLAADAFCASRGFASAESFFKWRFAIRDCGVTVAIGTGTTCTDKSCEGFRIIVCQQDGAGTTGPVASDAEALGSVPSDLGALAPGPAEPLNDTIAGLDEPAASSGPPKRRSVPATPSPPELPASATVVPSPELTPGEAPAVGVTDPPQVAPLQPAIPEESEEEAELPPKKGKQGKGGKKGKRNRNTGGAFTLKLDRESCSQVGILGAFSAANSACQELTVKCTAGGDGGRKRTLKSAVESSPGFGLVDAQRSHQLRGLRQKGAVKACKENFMESCLTTASQQTQKIMGTCQELLLNGPTEPVPGCTSFTEIERIFNEGISTLCAESLDDILP